MERSKDDPRMSPGLPQDILEFSLDSHIFLWNSRSSYLSLLVFNSLYQSRALLYRMQGLVTF